MSEEQVKILAFAAHPDDVELACSGTIINQVALGNKVGIVDFTRGEMGTRGTVEERREEAMAAAAVMGVSFRKILDLGDGCFETGKKEKEAIIREIRTHRPEIVLANAIKDRHPDHGRGALLLKDAVYYSGLEKISTKDESGKDQLPWRPRLLAHYIQSQYIEPDFVVDITKHWEKKMEAIRCFKSQFYNPESEEPQTFISRSQFLELIKARAQEMGNLRGFDYAEGFTMDYAPGISDITSIY